MKKAFLFPSLLLLTILYILVLSHPSQALQTLTTTTQHSPNPSTTVAGQVAVRFLLLGTEKTSIELLGLNLSGAGFAPQVLPGVEGTNYFFPKESHFKYWSGKGVRLIRFPIIWERLQQNLGEDLDTTYAGLIDTFFELANKYDMQIILDLHNYMRYQGEIIGTANVPYASYQEIMTRIATRWHQEPSLYGYDIMNEPHGTSDYWPTAAQYGINGVRSIDTERPIFIEGNGWASSYYWPSLSNSLLALEDPADNIIFEAHAYFDADSSGEYDGTDANTLADTYAIERVKPFIEWLQENNKRGYLGEFGIPDDDSRWNLLVDNLLAYLKENCVPATYWAAGPNWGSYALSVEPVDGEERPQWPTLEKYLDNSSCTETGPL